MPGSLGLWRSVLRRMRADWAVVVAAALLLLIATSLLSTSVLYGDTVALAGLRRSIEAAEPIDRGVIVRTSVPGDGVEELREAVSAELIETFSGSLDEAVFVGRSGAFTAIPRSGGSAGPAPPAGEGDIATIASFASIDAHAALLRGEWARHGQSPIAATLSEGAATALGLDVGDAVTLVSRRQQDRSLAVVISGVWRPHEEDPYWFGDLQDLRGEEVRGPFTTRGPFVIALADLIGHPAIGELEVSWSAVPPADRVALDAVGPLGTAVASLPERLRSLVPASKTIAMSTGLPPLFDQIGRSVLVSRGGVAILTVQFGILAGYAIVMVAGMVVDRRRADVALLRSRGAGARQLAWMAFLEAILTALPGALLAPVIAVVLVRLLAIAGPLSQAGVPLDLSPSSVVVFVSLVAAGASAIALAAPAVLSAASPSAVRAVTGRQPTRTLPQRLGVDLAIVAIAAVALWQLRIFGSPLTVNARGALGLDPLLVAAPAIGLLAGALLALRIVPLLAEIGERVLVAGRGLVSPLGARQVSRRPSRYARAALLLMLAIALGTFGAAYGSTWTRSQSDQAAWQAVGDIRLVASEHSRLPAWSVGSAIRAVPEVAAALPVVREPLDVGRAIVGGTVLAFDPERLPEVVGATSGRMADRFGGALGRLAEGRPGSMAIAIPGEPRRLSIVVDADLGALPGSGPDDPVPAWDAIRTTIVIEDGDGRLQRLDGGPGSSSGSGQRIEIAVARTLEGSEVATSYPIRVRAIELRVTAPIGVAAGGSLTVRSLATSAEDSGGRWSEVPLAPHLAKWAWVRVNGAQSAPAVTTAGVPERVLIGSASDGSDAIFGSPTDPGALFRLWLPPETPDEIPALGGARFLALTGTQVGDVVSANVRGLQLKLRIVDMLDIVPPVGAEVPFVLLDGPTLDLARFRATAQTTPAAEWWLAVADGEAEAVMERLAASPLRPTSVIGRAAVADALVSDPVALGVLGALTLGSLAALLFATIGYLMSATVSAAERVPEFTILRALGLSRGQVSLWLTLEHTFLLVFGLLGGLGLGLLLAWVVLPSATFTASGIQVVPPAEIVVPWVSMIVLAAVSLVLLVITVFVVTRRISSARIDDVLRAGET